MMSWMSAAWFLLSTVAMNYWMPLIIQDTCHPDLPFLDTPLYNGVSIIFEFLPPRFCSLHSKIIKSKSLALLTFCAIYWHIELLDKFKKVIYRYKFIV